jgi:hypothetical protein
MNSREKKEKYPKLRGRELYLWGTGRQGRGLFRRLEAMGLKVRGFLDTRAESLPEKLVFGRPVSEPGPVLARGRAPDAPAIVVTPFFFQRELMGQAEAAGFIPGENLFALDQLTPFRYAVYISGVCNLHCLACPRGKGRGPARPGGLMKAETFSQVADKIVREDPLASSIQLYQWGEPLLNPELPAIIDLANRAGLAPAVSSNLNPRVDLAPVVRAKPAWFRASLSGFGPGYEITHTGGRWDLVRERLELLARLKAELNPDMKVEIFYHLYRHNRGPELAAARDFCQALGFEFQPVWAYLISLDEVLAWRETGRLPEEARRAADLLEIDLETALERARAESSQPCLVENVISVNWDLSVARCMMFYHREDNQAAEDFLALPLSEIQRLRAGSVLCGRCRREALHRYCQVYNVWPTEAA